MLTLKRAALAALALLLVSPRIGSAQTDSVAGGGTGSSTFTISIVDQPAYVSPYAGVPATGGTRTSCPAGRIALGLGGSRLKFIQSATLLCGTLNKDGTFASIAPIDPSAIPADARGFRLQCPNGHVVTRLSVAYHTDLERYPYVGGVLIGCTPWVGGQWSGTQTVASTTGFDGWPRKTSVACTGHTQPVRGLGVRSITYVKSISITCDEP